MKRNGKNHVKALFSMFFVLVFVLSVLPQTVLEAKAGTASIMWDNGADLGINGSKSTKITVEQGQKFYIGDYVLLWQDEYKHLLVGPYKTATMVKAGYSSSNKKVATVSGKGYLTAKKTGTSTIKIKYKGQAVTCRLKVVKAGSFGKKAIYKKLEMASNKLAKVMSSEITVKNGFDLLRAERDFDNWNGKKEFKDISSTGFLLKKVDGKFKGTEKLAVPQAGRKNTLYRQLVYYADKKSPFSLENSNILKIASVNATPKKVVITLNRSVTKEDILGAKIEDWVSNYSESDNEHYFTIYFYNVKDYSVCNIDFHMKEGSKTFTSVNSKEAKLKKGETYRLNNSLNWTKAKTVKVK